MPIITFEAPQLDIEKKRELVKEVAAACSKAYGYDEDNFFFLFHNLSREDVAVGPKIVSDMMAEKCDCD